MSRFRLTALTRPHGGGLENATRIAACALALLSIGAGLIHVTAAADHRNLPVMMAGFVAVATLQVAFGGIALWRRPGRALLAAGIALMAGSLGMWVLSRTAGLPLLPGGHMEPIGFKDGVAKVFELGAIGAALLLTSSELARLRLPSPRLGTQALAVLGAGMFVLSVPALILGGGGHHSAAQHAAMGGHGHGQDGTALASAGGHGHGDDAALADGTTHAGGEHHGAGGRHARAAGGHGAHGSQDAAVAGDLHAGGRHGIGGHGDGPEGAAGHGGGGHEGGSGEHDGARHRSGGDGHDGTQHAGGGHAGDAHAAHEDDEPTREGLAFENGKPGQGSAIVWRGKGSGSEGPGHHGESGPCNPTAEQRAAADKLVRDTRAALRVYDNDPAKALADGFYYAFGPTDRTMHMVAPDRIDEPAILNPARIESFLYAMTDDGWVAIGGMYIMPEHGMAGPEIGGCITKWHHHGGFGGRIASAGTMEQTPEMLHVWTYRGLEPYGHYDGRDFSQLFTPAAAVPSFCRQFGDASDVCLP